MIGAQRGFTIVEAMIVMSISALMLVSATTVFGGKRERTEFSQAVYDLQSKFQTWANNVSSESVPGLNDYTCSIGGGGSPGPVLSYNPGSGSAVSDCIYLGQALEVPTPASSSDTIYAYSVFGLRTVHGPGGVDTGVFPSNADEANPDMAVDGSNNPVLTEDYKLLNGLRVKSATASNSGAENDILMFYSSLQNSNISGNEINVTSFSKNYNNHNVNTVRQCIQGNAGCNSASKTSYFNKLTWDICVTDDTRTAKITVTGTPTGIATRIDMDGVGC
ncbi:type II secretion system GspH family protein [Candidatus Saccharibacteria bacterium]|nr:type II secretion system GspH family protein [Candidatus Saccharibacteria bacterium]